MIRRKQIILFALLGIFIALSASTVFADAHSDCMNGCMTTFHDNTETAIVTAGVALAGCVLSCFLLGPGCALCAVIVAAGLVAALALIADQAQSCINNCPPPTTG
jgi:hypothetical protein